MNSIKYRSVTVTKLFMQLIGFWPSKNVKKDKFAKFALINMFVALGIIAIIEFLELYHCCSNFDDAARLGVNLTTYFIACFKVIIMTIHRKRLLCLILYTQRYIWDIKYRNEDLNIIRKCESKSLYIICIYSFLNQLTMWSYFLSFVVENIYKNKDYRELPFKIWLNIPTSVSPYYEVLFIIQVLTVYFIAIAYACFDLCLCLMCSYIVGHFKILCKRLRNFGNMKNESTKTVDLSVKEIYQLKTYIQYHQSLVIYVDNLEIIFNLALLLQVTILSMSICLVGYLAIVIPGPIFFRFTFIYYYIAALFQLFSFTISSDALTRESYEVSIAIFHSNWYTLMKENSAVKIGKYIHMIIRRATKFCYLTAGGFFAVNLETFSKVLQTSLSFFTLMVQTNSDIMALN